MLMAARVPATTTNEDDLDGGARLLNAQEAARLGPTTTAAVATGNISLRRGQGATIAGANSWQPYAIWEQKSL